MSDSSGRVMHECVRGKFSYFVIHTLVVQMPLKGIVVHLVFLMFCPQSSVYVVHITHHLVTGTQCSDHISPVLHQLHCMASGMPTHWLQGRYACAPVAVWHFSIVSGRRLPSCRRCSWAATAFHSEPNMRCDTDTQHLWRQSICSCRCWTTEQSSIAPVRRWLIVRWIPAVAKDISVWTVEPQYSVNCINYAIQKYSYLLPSLLTSVNYLNRIVE